MVRLSTAVIIAMIASAVSVGAQGLDTSTISGTILDSTGGVLTGVSIVLSSDNLIGGPRRTTSDAAGEYRFPRLSSGIYELTVSLAGFTSTTRREIQLLGETTLVVDIRLDIAGIGEDVRVQGGPPLIDVKRSGSPIVLDRGLLDNLPVDRVVATVMNLAPGVNVSAGLGGTQQSNPIYVEGVNTTDVQQLSNRSAFNYNWVEEIQIVGVGANAEYSDFSGIAQTTTLRSGGNRVGGLAEYRLTQPSWVGTNTSSLVGSVQANIAAQSQRVITWHDVNGQLGGPLSKDRLWYFAGFQHFTNDVRPALVLGSDTVDENDRRMLIKLTSLPAAAMRLEGYYELDRYHLTNDGLAPDVAAEATTYDTLPNHNWNVRSSWVLDNRTTVEARTGGFAGTYSFDPPPPGTHAGPPGHVDVATGHWYGNASDYFGNRSTRAVAAVTITRYANAPRGHHDLKAGAEFETARQTSLHGYPGNRLFLDRNGQPFQVRLQDPYEQAATVHRTALYAQDVWSAGSRITVQAGMRATVNRGLVSQGTVFATNPIDPRGGVAWDVAADHKTVVRAHIGRYHDALLTAHFQALDSAPLPPLITANVVGPDQFVEVSRFTATSNYTLDANISNAYFDQAVAGIERELWPHWSVTAQVIRRQYKHLIGVLDIGTVYRPIQSQDPGPDGVLGTADDGRMITVYLNTNTQNPSYYITSPTGAYRKYSAAQLIARKQYANNWQMQVSYVWSSTRGTIDNEARSNAGGTENGYNGIFADSNRAINAEGPSPFDFTHELKALATWRVPVWGGVNISSVYQYHTGLAWARSVPSFRLGLQQFVTFGVRVEPRGSRRTDALNQLDVRAEKTFDLHASRRVGVFADVFNLNNQGIPDPSKIFAVDFRSGPAFGQPLNWVAPRTVRGGVRLSF